MRESARRETKVRETTTSSVCAASKVTAAKTRINLMLATRGLCQGHRVTATETRRVNEIDSRERICTGAGISTCQSGNHMYYEETHARVQRA